jgi:hypothetical protein
MACFFHFFFVVVKDANSSRTSCCVKMRDEVNNRTCIVMKSIVDEIRALESSAVGSPTEPPPPLLVCCPQHLYPPQMTYTYLVRGWERRDRLALWS